MAPPPPFALRPRDLLSTSGCLPASRAGRASAAAPCRARPQTVDAGDAAPLRYVELREGLFVIARRAGRAAAAHWRLPPTLGARADRRKASRPALPQLDAVRAGERARGDSALPLSSSKRPGSLAHAGPPDGRPTSMGCRRGRSSRRGSHRACVRRRQASVASRPCALRLVARAVGLMLARRAWSSSSSPRTCAAQRALRSSRDFSASRSASSVRGERPPRRFAPHERTGDLVRCAPPHAALLQRLWTPTGVPRTSQHATVMPMLDAIANASTPGHRRAPDTAGRSVCCRIHARVHHARVEAQALSSG